MNLTPSPFAAPFPKLPEVKGVRAATGSRGFYARRGVTRDDVFLFAFDEGTTCAGVYTVSRTASADVLSSCCRIRSMTRLALLAVK